MWTRSHSTFVDDLSIEQLWQVWSDVDQWHVWDDVDAAHLNGTFASGQTFAFKPKGGPNLTLLLKEVKPYQSFTDMTTFPLARMYGQHEFIAHGDHRVEIKVTMSIEGALAWLWRKIVAEGIVKGLPEQAERLIRRTRAVNGLI